MPKRVSRQDDVAGGVVLLNPGVAVRIDRLDQLVLLIVDHLDHRAVHALMTGQVAASVVVEELGAAVAVDVLHQLVVAVAVEPFLAAVRVNDPERIALDGVVVPGDLPECVGDRDHPETRMPREPNLVAAVVPVLAHAARFRICPVPLQVHAAPGAVGVARQQVVTISILTSVAVSVAGRNQIALRVILVGSEAPHALAVRVVLEDFDDSPARVVLERDLPMRHEQAIEAPRLVIVGRQLIAGAVLDERQAIPIAVAFVCLEHVVATRQCDPPLVDPQQCQVFGAVVVGAAHFQQGVIETAAFRIVIDEFRRLHVEAHGVRRDPPRPELALLVVAVEKRSIGSRPGNRQRAVDHEIVMVDPLVAQGIADRAGRTGGRRGHRPGRVAAIRPGVLRRRRGAERLGRPLPAPLLGLRGALRRDAHRLRLGMRLAPAHHAFLAHEDQPADLAHLVAIESPHRLLHGRHLPP